MRRLTGPNRGSRLTNVSAVLSRLPGTLFASWRSDSDFSLQLFSDTENGNRKLKRESGSHVGIIGSGPTERVWQRGHLRNNPG